MQKKKELNVISLQQIVGKHILLPLKEPIKKTLLQKAKDRPKKYHIIEEKIFNVLSPNRTNITLSGSGGSPWILLIGSKSLRKKLQVLLIGNRIWGVELDAGMKMKCVVVKSGEERLIKFLIKQIKSMLDTPDSWEIIEVYLRT